MTRFDDIRALYPHLGLALYALDPGHGVTLEIHPPGGDVMTWSGPSAAAILDDVFPPEPDPEPVFEATHPEPADTRPPGNFDLFG